MTSVASKIIEIKKREVREDENRKVQSLKQFHEWINKHQFIRNFHINDELLLSLLRTRKYQMDSVFDNFEKYLLLARRKADWYDWRGEKYEKIMKLYDQGFMKVLTQRDSDGCRIVIVNNKANVDEYTSDDIFRLSSLILFILSLEEETQLCGIKMIDDLSDINMKYLSIFSISTLYNIAIDQKIIPLRVKNISVVGLPPIGVQFLNAVKLGFSPKIKKRLIVMSSRDELWNNFERKIFTTDFDGGEVDERKVIDDFRKIINAKIDLARNIIETYEIDTSKAEVMKNDGESVGSFRQLEID